MVWTLIEPGVAIVASSLVTIRPLLHAMRIKGFMSTENSTAPRYPNLPRSTWPGPRAYARGSMPAFGRGDIRLADMETPGPGPSPPAKQSVHTSNNSDVSLQTAVAVEGPVYSSWEVQVDEVPLNRSRS